MSLGVPLRIVEEGPDRFAAHGQIPISFKAVAKLDTDLLKNGEWKEISIEPYFKDYDADPAETPAALAKRASRGTWTLLAGYSREVRIGGAILAFGSDDFPFLGPPGQVAAIVDIRVLPEHREKGIGRKLIQASLEWAARHGLDSVRVETQDANVGACRLYRNCGFHIHAIDAHAYVLEPTEIQLIWERKLRT